MLAVVIVLFDNRREEVSAPDEIVRCCVFLKTPAAHGLKTAGLAHFSSGSELLTVGLQSGFTQCFIHTGCPALGLCCPELLMQTGPSLALEARLPGRTKPRKLKIAFPGS